jgi:hypothetical protein
MSRNRKFSVTLLDKLGETSFPPNTLAATAVQTVLTKPPLENFPPVKATFHPAPSKSTIYY